MQVLDIDRATTAFGTVTRNPNIQHWPCRPFRKRIRFPILAIEFISSNYASDNVSPTLRRYLVPMTMDPRSTKRNTQGQVERMPLLSRVCEHARQWMADTVSKSRRVARHPRTRPQGDDHWAYLTWSQTERVVRKMKTATLLVFSTGSLHHQGPAPNQRMKLPRTTTSILQIGQCKPATTSSNAS